MNELEEIKKLNQQVIMLYQKGKYEEAIPLAKKTLEICEILPNKKHPEIVQNLHNLALLYQSTEKYSDAELSYKKALEIQEKTLGKDHPDVATTLHNLGGLYYIIGKYNEAISYIKRALEIKKEKFGENHPVTVTSLHQLALLYQSTARYSEAEQLCKKVCETIKKEFGENHPNFARSLLSLAELYKITRRYTDAEPLYKRSLDILEKTLGKDHPHVIASLNNLAEFYYSRGRHSEAEPLYKKVLEIWENKYGKEHPNVAKTLNKLAVLCIGMSAQRYPEAELLLKRALEIKEKTLGRDHPDLAESLTYLAQLYHITERYSEAEPLFKRALGILEKTSSGNYSIETINNLAQYYCLTERYPEAEFLYKKALDIKMKALGKDHPDVASSIHNLAKLYARIGRHIDSHQYFKEAWEIREKMIKDVFTILSSENQKMRYRFEYSLSDFLSHTAQYLKEDPEACRDALDAWLRWKGSILESQSRHQEVLFCAKDPKVVQTYKELTDTKRKIANLNFLCFVNTTSDPVEYKKYKKILYDSEVEKNRLEEEINDLSKEYRIEKQVEKVDSKKLSAILPQGSFLIEFAKPYFFGFKGSSEQTKESRELNTLLYFSGSKRGNQQALHHYLAFILSSNTERGVTLIDLGDAKVIDGYIDDYRKEMDKQVNGDEKEPRLEEKNLSKISRKLYEKIFKPIREVIVNASQDNGNPTTIFISPDGDLNLIPFEVFMTPEGKYLIDEYQINYVSAGRDMMRFKADWKMGKDAIIMGNPDYNFKMGKKEDLRGDSKIEDIKKTRSAVSSDTPGLPLVRPLSSTKDEAEAIGNIIRKLRKVEPLIYFDDKAIEGVLYNIKEPPEILHLSTHGFFLKDLDLEEKIRRILQPEAQKNDVHNLMNLLLGTLTVDVHGMLIESPMLRSGIALAGYNASVLSICAGEGRDEGIVTADKLTGINLKGTSLVVLSACDTAIGGVKAGEGVFGLKRAFTLAGAETLVMSLWKVPSEETKDIMVGFYDLMMNQGKGKGEALRQARLYMKKEKPHPYYWGAFISIGKPH